MNRTKRAENLQANFPTIQPGDLIQSHRAGKIHHWTCGHRASSSSVVDIQEMSREEAVAKFGSQLCGFCFPEVMENVTPAPKQEEPEDDICPGSGTRNWINGNYPEVWRPGGFKLKGTCKHCGQVVPPATNKNPRIRKHKLPNQ